MSLSKAIGGFFELETHDFGTVYHDEALAVNSGRNALKYILRSEKYEKIYIPYYTCDVTLEPVKKLNLAFEFYFLDEKFLPKLSAIGENEVLLYVNYFGLFDSSIASLRKTFRHLIIDNSQAFYSKAHKSLPAFYSPRKFFGVPDGGFAYCDKKINIALDIDKSADRISHLVGRIENGPEAAYKTFQQNDAKLNNLPLRKMSKLTTRLLRNIDYEQVRKKRNSNFLFLHRFLKSDNELTKIIEKQDINGPMVYPFLRKGNQKLREHLIRHKVFTAQYWPNVPGWIKGKDIFEKHLHDNLLPLPIDQRYTYDNLVVISELINK